MIICETNGENCLCHRRGTDSFRLRFYSIHSRMYRFWKSEGCSPSSSTATLAPPASTAARTSFNPANQRATEMCADRYQPCSRLRIAGRE